MAQALISPVFVGRRDELTTLLDGLEAARNGAATAVLLSGEAGVGKSRLVAELSARAAGARVLTGYCVELSADGLPLAPLVDVLRSLVRSCSAEELALALGSGRTEWARLLPELGEPGGAGPSPELSTAQLLELALGVLERLAAHRPLVLVLEDLHWADRSTLELAAFLVRVLRDVPVLLVLTYRSDELGRRHPLRPLLGAWERARSVRKVELSRFVRSEVAEQLSAILGPDGGAGLVDRVFERSAGNAFLVEEVVGAVAAGEDADALPQSLRDLLLMRTEHLSDATQRVLRMAAVAGAWSTDALLSAVSGLPDADLYDALREAVDLHVLVIGSRGGYAFRHELLREALYDELLPGERVRLHGAYARAIEADAGVVRDETAATAFLAHHWYAAHDLPRALGAAVTAARHAAASLATAEAARHLDRALEIWPAVADADARVGLDHPALLGLAADLTLKAGDVTRATQLIDTAVAELPADAAARRGELIARKALILGDVSELHRTLEDVLAELGAEPTPARATILTAAAAAALRHGEPERAIERATAAIEAATAVGSDHHHADALVTLGTAQGWMGNSDAGIELLRRALALAVSVDAQETALRAYANVSDLLEEGGRHVEAAALATDGMEYAVRVGLSRSFGTFLGGNKAESLLRMGRLAEADELALERLRLDPEGVFAATIIEIRAELALVGGRTDEAAQLLRSLRPLLPETWDDQYALPYVAIDAGVALARADPEAAAVLVAGVLPRVDGDTSPRYLWPVLWVGMRAEAELASGSPASDERAARLLEIAAGNGRRFPAHVGYAELVRAEDARRLRTGERAAWTAAVDAWRATEEPYPLAYALRRFAAAGFEDGERTEAAAALREASVLASSIGATPLADDIAELARRARVPLDGGAEVPAADELSRRGLTAREREILALVAAGQSNPQIAAALFISVKTVSVHVSNILAKLGVTSRGQAAALAHRLGVQ